MFTRYALMVQTEKYDDLPYCFFSSVVDCETIALPQQIGVFSIVSKALDEGIFKIRRISEEIEEWIENVDAVDVKYVNTANLKTLDDVVQFSIISGNLVCIKL